LFLFVGGSTATRADKKEQKKRDLRVFKRMLFAIAIAQALCASALRFSRRNKHKAADVGLHNQSMTRENDGLTPWKV